MVLPHGLSRVPMASGRRCRSRPVRPAIPGAANWPITTQESRSTTSTSLRRSRRGCTFRTGRSMMRCTCTAHSCRAKCTRQVSYARIATIPTATLSGWKQTSFARSATSLRCTTGRSITGINRAARAPPVLVATCRSKPTWWSTTGTITASGYPSPGSPWSWVYQTPATSATMIKTRNGRSTHSIPGGYLLTSARATPGY